MPDNVMTLAQVRAGVAIGQSWPQVLVGLGGQWKGLGDLETRPCWATCHAVPIGDLLLKVVSSAKSRTL